MVRGCRDSQTGRKPNGDTESEADDPDHQEDGDQEMEQHHARNSGRQIVNVIADLDALLGASVEVLMDHRMGHADNVSHFTSMRKSKAKN